MTAKHKPNLLPQGLDDRRYTRTLIGDFARATLRAVPPHWREAAAERWFRIPAHPVRQMSTSFNIFKARNARGHTDAGAGGIDRRQGRGFFYERQYRQYLNPTMGAYAATATVAFLGSGGQCRGHLWGKYRPVCAATLEAEAQGAPLSPFSAVKASPSPCCCQRPLGLRR